jgi:hypothetical protein
MTKAGDRFSSQLYKRLRAEEYTKLSNASNRDVHDTSKNMSLPIAREIIEACVMDDVTLQQYIDLLNINLDNLDLKEAERRIRLLAEALRPRGWNPNHQELGLVMRQTTFTQDVVEEKRAARNRPGDPGRDGCHV